MRCPAKLTAVAGSMDQHSRCWLWSGTDSVGNRSPSFPGQIRLGADIDESALRLGRRLAPEFAFVHVQAEQLPFSNASLDIVISRVALPYTYLPLALAEIQRISKPGSTVWLSLHPVELAWRWLWRNSRSFNLKGIVYQIYVLLNGLLFHLTGRQFRYPLNRQWSDILKPSHVLNSTRGAIPCLGGSKNSSETVSARSVKIHTQVTRLSKPAGLWEMPNAQHAEQS